MLKVLADNYAKKNQAVTLFEMSKVYLPKSEDELPDEPGRITLGFTTSDDKNGFYRMKGYIEAILDIAGITNTVFKAEKNEPTFHPGRCAVVYSGDKKLGIFGEAYPEVSENYGIGARVYLAELESDNIFDTRRREIEFTPIPKHPAIERDFSFVCDEELEAASVVNAVKAASNLVSSVELFDIYRGPQLGIGKKSMSYAVMLRASDRTLTDTEADEAVKSILSSLEKELGIKLR